MGGGAMGDSRLGRSRAAPAAGAAACPAAAAAPAGLRVDPPHNAADDGAAAAARIAGEAGRLAARARRLLDALDHGRIDPGAAHGRPGSGGAPLLDGPGGPPGPESSSSPGAAGPPDDSDHRRPAGAPRAVGAEPGWAAAARALQLVLSEGQRLVEAAGRLDARWAEGDPGRASHLDFLIDLHPPDWQEPQDPPHGCLSGGLP